MTRRLDGEVFDFVPARSDGPRLLPEHDEAVWSPGDGRVLPEPVLGAAVPLMFEADPVSIGFFERTQPRSMFTLSWWIKCDWKPTVERLAEQSWPPPVPDLDASGSTAEVVGPELKTDDDRPLISVAMLRERSRRTRVAVKVGETGLTATVDIDTPSSLEISRDPGVDSEDWHHLAVTFDGSAGALTLFLDGTNVASTAVVSPHLDYVKRPRVVLDGDAGQRKILWLGPVRLFDGVRPAAELLAERHRDRVTYPTIDQRNPLAFRLADDRDEPVIYITDADVAGRPLHVVVENRSRFPVELPRWRPGAEIDEFLEFRFRPGCLIGGAHHWIEPHSPTWHVESSAWTDGGTSLFVGRMSRLTLSPGQSAALTLHHVRADAALGAHGTHVELVYTHPHHPELLSTRVSPAEVRGQRGRRNSPLRLAILGHQTVVNDGRRNTLKLSIINTSPTHAVMFDPPIRGYGSRLTLSMDGGDVGHRWALATYNQLRESEVSVDGPGPWQVGVELLGEHPQWTLTPTRAQTLEPKKTMTILVKGLRTEMDIGRSQADLRLENIAGYWDDNFQVEIEKSHVVEDDEEGEALDVEGDLRVAGTLLDRYGELLPGGVIAMWHGLSTDVPDGWVLCNGENRTPDLSDRFIRASAGPAANEAGRHGGQNDVSLATANLPAHNHRIPGAPTRVISEALQNRSAPASEAPAVVAISEHSIQIPIVNLFGNPVGSTDIELRSSDDLTDEARELSQWVVNETARVSATSVWNPTGNPASNSRVDVGATGGGQSFDNRPAFYDLCFIMKRLPPAEDANDA